MKPVYIVLIVIAALIVAAAVVVYVLYKRGPRGKKLIMESRRRINLSVQAVEPLKLLFADNADAVKELEKLQDELRYLTPSPSAEVKKIDENIFKLLRVARDEKTSSIAFINNIKMELADRLMYTKEL